MNNINSIQQTKKDRFATIKKKTKYTIRFNKLLFGFSIKPILYNR